MNFAYCTTHIILDQTYGSGIASSNAMDQFLCVVAVTQRVY